MRHIIAAKKSLQNLRAGRSASRKALHGAAGVIADVLEPRRLLTGNSIGQVAGDQRNYASSTDSDYLVGTSSVPTSHSGTSDDALLVPAHHSRPGAAVKLFLDFDGGTLPWNPWNPPSTPFDAFSLDADVTTFNSTEIATMNEIWARVAEMYSPFNVDVTTVDPGVRTPNLIASALITQGGPLAPGGKTPLGGFHSAGENASIVFGNRSGNDAHGIAMNTAHELGHQFGLDHQSTWVNGVLQNDGYNTGNADEGPIMGAPFGSQRFLWYYGPTPVSPTTYQDDLSILTSSANGFGYAPDLVGDTTSTATYLGTLGGGADSFIEPGVFERSTDKDYYSFDVTGSGNVQFAIRGAYWNSTRIGMVNADLQVLNSAGTAVGTSWTSSLDESMTLNLSPGRYYVRADTAENYGDVGQYTLMINPLDRAGVNRTLWVRGRGGDDQIGISYSGGQTHVATDFGGTFDLGSASYSKIQIDLGSGDDVLSFDTNTIPGNPSTTLNGGDGNDCIIGSAGADYINGDASVDSLYGGAGNDTLVGGAGSDSLYGDSDNDLLDGGLGGTDGFTGSNDYLNGGDGNDTLASSDSGNCTLVGGNGNDQLDGAAGNDVLQGGPGNDLMGGYGGADYMEGGQGNDTMYGGDGNDFVDGGAGGADGYTTVDADVVFGEAGNDSVYAADYGYATLDGGDGNDFVYGQNLADSLNGGTGNDSLVGNGGNDVIDPGMGTDTASGGDGNDFFLAAEDTTSAKNYGLFDIYNGDGGVNTISYYGRQSGVSVYLDGTASSGAALVGDFAEQDQVLNCNTAIGTDYVDYLRGASGNDTLIGDGGDDQIAGGGGADSISGGLGYDNATIDTSDVVDQDVEERSGVQSPYRYFDGVATAAQTIQAENFDWGGEGLAYHDTTPGNDWGNYRFVGPDVHSLGSPINSPVVSNFGTGEYVEYTVDVPRTGLYRFDFSSVTGTTAATGAISLPDVGGAPSATFNVAARSNNNYIDYQTASAQLNLPAGRQTLRVTVASGNFDLDWLKFSDIQPPSAPTAIAWSPNTRTADITFGEPLLGNLTASNVDVILDSNGSTVAAPIVVTNNFGGDPSHVGISFTQVPPSGHFHFAFHASTVADQAGNVATTVLASPSISFLAGDANNDGLVNFSDLVILAQNYGKTGQTFSQGNFNYDPAGSVDFSDLVILAQHYGSSSSLTLPSAAPEDVPHHLLGVGIANDLLS